MITDGSGFLSRLTEFCVSFTRSMLRATYASKVRVYLRYSMEIY